MQEFLRCKNCHTVGYSHIRRISIVYLKFKCNFSLVTHVSFYPFVWFMRLPKLPVTYYNKYSRMWRTGMGKLVTKGRHQRAGAGSLLVIACLVWEQP